MARGCCTARASNDTPPGRPPFGGQGSLCASFLHAASYTLLPLRGISPQGETRNCPTEPCAPLRGRGPRIGAGGAVRQEPQMILHPGRPPFGGQGCLCASSLHASLYTLLPLRGISPQGETRDCAASPCAPLRGRGPRSGVGVLYGKSLG